MARPRTFSLDDATDRAMQVFWRQGYDEAGLSELLDAMGIVRGSFYKAFGSKQALFLRVLERYDAQTVSSGVALLEDETIPGRDRIALFFESGLAAARAGDRRGCLLCNTASGPVLEDEAVREAVRAQMDRLATGFEAALAAAGVDEAIRRGEAQALLMRYVGLQVLGRGGADPELLAEALPIAAGSDPAGSDLAGAGPTLQ